MSDRAAQEQLVQELLDRVDSRPTPAPRRRAPRLSMQAVPPVDIAWPGPVLGVDLALLTLAGLPFLADLSLDRRREVVEHHFRAEIRALAVKRVGAEGSWRDWLGFADNVGIPVSDALRSGRIEPTSPVGLLIDTGGKDAAPEDRTLTPGQVAYEATIAADSAEQRAAASWNRLPQWQKDRWERDAKPAVDRVEAVGPEPSGADATAANSEPQQPDTEIDDPRILAIRKFLDAGQIPARNTRWGIFHGLVLKECNAQQRDRGFGDKTIQNLTREEMKRRKIL